MVARRPPTDCHRRHTRARDRVTRTLDTGTDKLWRERPPIARVRLCACASGGVAHARVCAVSQTQTGIAGGTERRPALWPQAVHLFEPEALGVIACAGCSSRWKLVDRAAPRFWMRTTFRTEVVPKVVLDRISDRRVRASRRRTKSRDADERGQMAVLVGELDEFDASFTALECVAQTERLRGPDGRVAPLLPHPEQRAKARRAVGQ